MIDIAPQKLVEHQPHDQQIYQREKDTPEHAQNGSLVFQREIPLNQLREQEFSLIKLVQHLALIVTDKKAQQQKKCENDYGKQQHSDILGGKEIFTATALGRVSWLLGGQLGILGSYRTWVLCILNLIRYILITIGAVLGYFNKDECVNRAALKYVCGDGEAEARIFQILILEIIRDAGSIPNSV